jgi:hypothetical protein
MADLRTLIHMTGATPVGIVFLLWFWRGRYL